MKHMKRFMALFAALALVLAMAVPAFADEPTSTGAEATTGTITINNAVSGVTYKFYRIMEIASHTSDNPYTGVVYKANSEWTTFLQKEDWKDCFKVNADNTVTVVKKEKDNGEFAKKFAEEAAKEASSKAVDYTATTENGKIQQSVQLGYYLVVPDGWKGVDPVVCSLGSTNPNVTINEKNGKPTIEKEVKEGNDFGDRNDAAIGDYVEFQLTIDVVDGTPVNYVAHDTMSAGLTFVNKGEHSLSIKRNDKTLESSNYQVVTEGIKDGCAFEVKFNDDENGNSVLKTNDKVVITYWAQVNENAVVGATGNTNSAILRYGTNGTAQGGQTTTYVWSFDVKKYTKDSDSREIALAGAKFQVKNSDKSKTAYFKYDATAKVYKFAGWTAVEGAVYEFTTPDDGNIAFKGLDSGTYYLEEIEAPKGYNKLNDAIKFTIADEKASEKGQVSYGTDGGTGIIKVLNKAGTTLPTTGGIGTTIFYLIGGGLMVAAAVLLIAKKRMENK